MEFCANESLTAAECDVHDVAHNGSCCTCYVRCITVQCTLWPGRWLLPFTLQQYARRDLTRDAANANAADKSVYKIVIHKALRNSARHYICRTTNARYIYIYITT